MEFDKTDKKNQKRMEKRRRYAEYITPKDYEEMYEKNDDVFSLLGQSKAYEELSHMSYDTRKLIQFALAELDFNESTTPAQLSQIAGIRVRTFDQLTDLIEEVYFRGANNVTIANKELDILVKEVLNRAQELELTLQNREYRLTPQDFIALCQHQNIAKNNIPQEALLTDEKLDKLGLKLAKDAVAYTFDDSDKAFFGWESVRFFDYSGTLNVPMKDLYTNEWLLDEAEQTFENYTLFHANLKTRKLQIIDKYSPISNEQPVILDGKKLIVDNRNLSQTEEAVLMMYEINKKALEEKSWFRDKSKKRIKDYFKRQGHVSKAYVSAYKDFKLDKSRFSDYKEALNDVIATLATINYARIYMKDSTFQKVEQNLTMQASQKLASLPRVHSSWVLPYIAERVLEVSKQNYIKAGLSDSEIKDLYKQTGRDVDNLSKLEEFVFAKNNPNFVFEKATFIDEEYEGFSKNAGSYRAYTQEEIKNMGLSKLLQKHKKASQSQQKAKEEKYIEDTTDTLKDDVKEEKKANTHTEKTNCTNDINLAKANLKEFLKRNLTMQGDFSNTKQLRHAKESIIKHNKNNIDMEVVTDLVYNKIAKDIDKNTKNYRRKDGEYYLEGWRLFMDYFKSIGSSLTPDTLFKDMVNDVVDEMTKHQNNETNSEMGK